MTRLVDTVRHMRWAGPPDLAMWNEAAKGPLLRVIDAQSVFEYTKHYDNGKLQPPKVCGLPGNFRPAFPNLWIEWLWRGLFRDDRDVLCDYQVAVHTLHVEGTARESERFAALVVRRKVGEALVKQQYKPFEFVVAKDGELLVASELLHDAEADRGAAAALSFFLIASAVIRFTNYRNARLIEHGPTRAQRRRHERCGEPLPLRYSTIAIDPLRPRRPGVAASTLSADEAASAWHLVRGHEVTYRADRPMFGNPKLHGTFWVPAHERGSKERGVVVSDYRVQAPRGRL